MKNIYTLFFTIAFIVTLLISTGKTVYAVENVSDPAAQLPSFKPLLVDTRVTKLRAFLHKYNSPLEDEASVIIAAADHNNIDWRLIPAIAGTESTFGVHIPAGSYNAWGWGIYTGANDGVHFKDWTDGVQQVTKGIRENYFNKGAKNLEDIGWIYAANGDSWSSHVQFFIDRINSYTPTDPQYLDVNI